MPKDNSYSLQTFFKDRRKMLIFLMCLLVAALSWLLISLQKNYTTTLLVPIRYANLPEGKTLLNEVPKQIAVNVAGSGFDLVSYDRSGLKDTFVVNLGNLTLGKYGSFERGFLNQAELSKNLQSKLNGAVSIQRIINDSLVFLFDLEVTRTLTVKANTRLTFEKGYVQNGEISIQPSEIEVTGALSLLDTMTAIKTDLIALNELNTTQEISVPVAAYKVGMKLAVPSVSVTIPVDQLTEKSFMIEPTLLNVPPEFEMRTFPRSIEVTVTLPLSFYNHLKVDDILLSVDYDLLEEGYMVLPVAQNEWPVYADRVRLKPDKVEVVLTKLK